MNIQWTPDDCYDPSHREAYVVIKGETWHLHQTIQGYGFTARPEPYTAENAARIRHAYSLEELKEALS